METKEIPIHETGMPIKDQCSIDSFYVNFTDDDLDDLSQYAYDMGYVLEPEMKAGEQHHPTRLKVISKTNPAQYGWVSKVNEHVNNEWQESFLYGFYRKHRYFNKYPISFMIQSKQMRGKMKRNAEKNPRQVVYFRTIFGILDLEPEENALDFIFSWLWSVKFQHHGENCFLEKA